MNLETRVDESIVSSKRGQKAFELKCTKFTHLRIIAVWIETFYVFFKRVVQIWQICQILLKVPKLELKLFLIII